MDTFYRNDGIVLAYRHRVREAEVGFFLPCTMFVEIVCTRGSNIEGVLVWMSIYVCMHLFVVMEPVPLEKGANYSSFHIS